MADKKKPMLPNLIPFMQAGVDPKTKLPTRMKEVSNLKPGFKQFLRIIDEQDAVNRYKWYNLPCNLSSQEVERLLYYRGQLAFFYLEELDQFYFMPYALDGTIDFYGRFNQIHPIPFANGTTKAEQEASKRQLDYLSTKKYKCLYAIPTDDEPYEHPEEYCVLLHDYTKQLSQTIVARREINDPILDVEAELMPFMRTALLMGTGIKGVRVNDADEQEQVRIASQEVEKAALSGNPWLALLGQLEFQELTDGTITKAEDYLLAMQSIDNLRLSSYGLNNGGLFEKKQHMLQAEQDMNNANNGVVFQDGLTIRQNFCNIVNALFGLGIWCEPNESAVESDTNMDGVAYDENDNQTGVEVKNDDNATEI